MDPQVNIKQNRPLKILEGQNYRDKTENTKGILNSIRGICPNRGEG